jgi:hypothetical protein
VNDRKRNAVDAMPAAWAIKRYHRCSYAYSAKMRSDGGVENTRLERKYALRKTEGASTCGELELKSFHQRLSACVIYESSHEDQIRKGEAGQPLPPYSCSGVTAAVKVKSRGEAWRTHRGPDSAGRIMQEPLVLVQGPAEVHDSINVYTGSSLTFLSVLEYSHQ